MDKTRIYPLNRGIIILGFTFRLTGTGRVVRILDPDNVKHERKKLYRMAMLLKAGAITGRKYWQCYESWTAHAKLGNSYKLLQRMNKYAGTLYKEANKNVRIEKDDDTEGNCGPGFSAGDG